MIARLSQKTMGVGRQSPHHRNSSSGSQTKISASKPKFHRGDFKSLEPINPHRQRITVALTELNVLNQQEASSNLNQVERTSSVTSDPYPNLIIYGDA